MLPGPGDSEEEAKRPPFVGVHRGETSNEPLTTQCGGRSRRARGSLRRLPEEVPLNTNLKNEREFARSKETHAKGSGFKSHPCPCVRQALGFFPFGRAIMAAMLTL